jgi:hypothetical protein
MNEVVDQRLVVQHSNANMNRHALIEGGAPHVKSKKASVKDNLPAIERRRCLL